MWDLTTAIAEYELAFKKPVFDVPKSSVELLQAFHEAFSPRFLIQPSEMQVLGGTALSDVVVQIAFGVFSFEIRIDRLKGVFHLRGSDDVTSAKDCIHLAEDSLFKVLPQIDRASSSIRLRSWLNCQDGKEEADKILGQFNGKPGFDVPIEKLGASIARYDLTGTIENPEERWQANYVLQPSALKDSHVFFVYDVTYQEGGSYPEFDDRAKHFGRIFFGVLDHFGIAFKREDT